MVLDKLLVASCKCLVGLKPVMVLSSLLIFASCGPSPVTSVEETEEYVPAEPKTLYILHCESCHGMDGKKGNSGAKDLSASAISDAQIKNTILNGNDKGMMPYKDIITSDQEVNSLMEYVKTLRK